MKYETPKLTVLIPAINAIQSSQNGIKVDPVGFDGTDNEGMGVYMDWE